MTERQIAALIEQMDQTYKVKRPVMRSRNPSVGPFQAGAIRVVSYAIALARDHQFQLIIYSIAGYPLKKAVDLVAEIIKNNLTETRKGKTVTIFDGNGDPIRVITKKK